MAYYKFLCSHMFPDGIRYMVTHVTCPLYSNHCQGRSRDPIFVTQFDYLKQPVRFNRFHRPFWTFQNIIVSLFHSFFFLSLPLSHPFHFMDVYICIYVHMYVCICVRRYKYVCMYVCVCVCMYVYCYLVIDEHCYKCPLFRAYV